MSVTLEDLKDNLNIDYDDFDKKLQRKLDAAIDIIQSYTDVYITEKEIEVYSDGCPLEFFQYPIEVLSVEINGNPVSYNRQNFGMSIEITAPKGSVIKLKVGRSDYRNIAVEEAVLRTASYLFENIDINEVTLPVDVQMIVNKERRSATI